MAVGELAAGAEVGERYQLRQLIGTGGMASVWRARDEVTGGDVALKLLSDTLALDPDSVNRFEHEAWLAGTLAHPNIVAVLDHGGSSGRPFLVMEFLPGGSLAQRLRAPDPPHWDRTEFALDVLAALVYVHGRDVLHRDMKPANVLFDADGRAKLADFGIAKLVFTSGLTRTGEVMGSERYVAPEVLRGHAADARSDLYSLGVSLREALARDSPEILRRLVTALVQEDPDRRPASAAEAREMLEGTAPMALTFVPQQQGHGHGEPPAPEPATPPMSSPAAPVSSGRAALRLVPGLLALTLLAAAVVGGFALRQQEAAPQPVVVPVSTAGSLGAELDRLDQLIDRARR